MIIKQNISYDELGNVNKLDVYLRQVSLNTIRLQSDGTYFFQCSESFANKSNIKCFSLFLTVYKDMYFNFINTPRVNEDDDFNVHFTLDKDDLTQSLFLRNYIYKNKNYSLFEYTFSKKIYQNIFHFSTTITLRVRKQSLLNKYCKTSNKRPWTRYTKH